ncbi:hypothetical protein A2865_02740 [Candidatus Woesebacteria bacterium RIFCSPHIGHO2_01_FULL_39_17]|uniref:Beta-lactamase class A-like protein n=3 Tax=Candidatus Woeseibacteriota TaxID=1752722 RepID=A0A0G0QSE6_9BACT|nr:MAG: beta-lactamase class A-like protein [Microgenomates group bacterium GW2011_GWC1_38_12]KKQ93364.1 MAG: beta-lactamase class A-like protein [Candidatus Woesebacteria bacterium GW2011_GWB1_39_10b]KKR13290.1 MAG: beta-lactamase class A-like protein [Candidatus Woesebacteria bacterium GW2011_GWA1_39_21b]OGM23221.1 MAG: hypothetical protein A2865_02740 [Candidatus Woesebacteria bacterium RIFCSPHIGHO2_01_FULL_39_17]OGM61123.1 MAG: hypothetical protein A3A52_03995 [Candidatus Woesebacteria bact
MAFFRKTKDEEEDYEDEEETRPRARRLKDKQSLAGYASKDFKDLKSENRRKRREPKKPWGTKERVFVLLIILLTAGTSATLAISARAWKLPGLPRVKFPTLSIPFFREETIILEGNQDSQVNRVNQGKAERVRREFKEKTKNLSGVYGLFVIHLDNGFSYGVNENETFTAASLIKLPVMAEMYIEMEDGRLRMEDRYTLKNSDKVAGAGSLYGKPAGYQITYRNLIQLMGKQSDNTAFNICRKLLGDEKIDEVIRSVGMVDTSLEKNETTPKDIGIFFEELWKGNIVSEESRDEILGALTDTIYEDWLAAGIPEGIRLAHKYGREVHVVNDAGIVFTDRPYVVVIMSKGVVEREADEIFPELAKLVYEIESGS